MHPRNPHDAENPACVGRMRFLFRYYHRRFREGKEVKPQVKWGAHGVYLVNCAKEAVIGQHTGDPLRYSHRWDRIWKPRIRVIKLDPRRLP